MSNPVGRPPIIDDTILQKLDEAFSWGCTDEEACLYADISPRTLYYYQEANEEFLQRKSQLKQTPVLKARKTVVEKVTESYSNAIDYLSRKKKDEFSPKSEVEHSGEVNVNFNGTGFYIHSTSEPAQGNASQEQIQSNSVRKEVGEDNTSSESISTGSLSK